MKTVKAWHFLSANKRLGYSDGRQVRLGRTLKIKGQPKLCEHGLHASRRLIDALKYAAGPIICRVDVGGDIDEGAGKLTGAERTPEWWINGTNLLHEFACRCAEDALRLAHVTDERCWNAIKVKRAWLAGKASDEELAAAESAAESTARSTAWNSARFAARGAARATARGAATAAARSAQNRRLTAMVVVERRKHG